MRCWRWYGWPSRALPVEFDPETRRVRHRDVAVDRPDRPIDERLCPVGVELVERLLDVEVRDAGAQLDCHRAADRSLRVVWRHDREMGLCHRGELAGPPEATEVERLGLEDVDDVVREQICELAERREALARGDRDGRPPRHLDHRAQLRVVDRLFQPGGLELGQSIGQPERGRGREAIVGLDHEVDVGTHRVADRPHDVDRKILVATILDPPGRPERIELHRGVAARRDLPGLVGDGVRVAVGPVPAVGVDADPVADLAAKKRVDRLSGRLADDVPARDLDRGDGGHVDLPAVGVHVTDHPLEEPLDVVRIEADVGLLELLDRGRDRGREPVDGPLTEAGHALVGADPGEQPVLPGVPRDARLDLRDSHSRSVAPWHDAHMASRGWP